MRGWQQESQDGFVQLPNHTAAAKSLDSKLGIHGLPVQEAHDWLSQQHGGKRSAGWGAVSSSSRARRHILLAVLVSSLWMLSSTLLIIVNKLILKELKFGYPMTVASLGMLSTSIYSYFVCKAKSLADTAERQAARSDDPAHAVTINSWCKGVLPVGLFMALSMWSGNLVYMYLTVSCIQMLKASAPVVLMLALFVTGLETPTWKMSCSVMAIAFGTALSAAGEINNSPVGVLIMLFSVACEAVRLVMTQLLLTGMNMDTTVGAMYLSPACFGWLTAGAVILEWPVIMVEAHYFIPIQHPWMFLLSSVMGIAVNMLTYATIKLASSLTLKVLGCARNAAVIAMAMLWFRDQVTVVQFLGFAISTGAFIVYIFVKMGQVASDNIPDNAPAKSRQ